MARVAWQVYDPVTDETFSLPINPLDANEPPVGRTLTKKATVAPGGKTVVFEGSAPAGEITVSGTILTEDHWQTLKTWVAKPRQLRVTDDLGQVFWVVFEKLAARRVRSGRYPWRRTYDLTYTIVDWP